LSNVARNVIVRTSKASNLHVFLATRMGHPNDTEPNAPAPENDTDPGEPAPDSEADALLDGLPRARVVRVKAVRTAIAAGENEAAYDAGPKTLDPGVATPPPEPAVVVARDSDRDAPTYRGAPPAPAKRPTMIWVGLAAGVVVVVAIVAAIKVVQAGTAPEPSVASAVPAAPSTSVAIATATPPIPNVTTDPPKLAVDPPSMASVPSATAKHSPTAAPRPPSPPPATVRPPTPAPSSRPSPTPPRDGLREDM